MSDKRFAVVDPATTDVIAELADLGVGEAIAAVDRVADAFEDWSNTAPRKRSEILRRGYELMLRDSQSLTDLISRENGKSLADAAAEVAYAAEFFRWFSEEAVREEGGFRDAPDGGVKSIVRTRPVGIAALVTPWNFPAAMVTRKIGPAMAAGCTALLKPAVETPLTALAIADLLAEAGLPVGVLEVVPTTDPASVVSSWIEDSRVRKISFTGSTGVGRQLLRQSSASIMNASMELGGNAPLVVTADADIDTAVAGTMLAKFRNGGQACTAANRLYVHADVAEEFTARLGELVEQLTVGPARDGNAIGPLISESAVIRVTEIVNSAVQEGARVAYTATPPTTPGYFYPPTILTNVPAHADILRQEIFGPVAPIVTWRDETEMLRLVNDTEFGLAAYMFAGDLQRALRLSERIEAGMVGVNRGLVSDPSAPFGGVKQSGLGREGAREGLREFQEVQCISVAWA